MEWISVEDRLPEPMEWVLCYGKDGYTLIDFVVESWMDFTNKDSSWFKRAFTHWCPLPEPPKQ